MAKFLSPFNRSKKIYEPANSGEVIVETAGYVSAKSMIESMISGGYQLDQFRRGVDGYETDEDAFANEDPTLDPDFDIVDGFQGSHDVVGRLEEQRLAAEKAAEEAKKAAESKPDNNPA